MGERKQNELNQDQERYTAWMIRMRKHNISWYKIERKVPNKPSCLLRYSYITQKVKAVHWIVHIQAICPTLTMHASDSYRIIAFIYFLAVPMRFQLYMQCVHVPFGGITLQDLTNVVTHLCMPKVTCTFVAYTFSCSIYICDACFVFKGNILIYKRHKLN